MHHSLTNTPPPDDTLRNLYVEQELTIQEIADEYGRAYSSVHGWMRRAGIERRPSVAELEGEDHPRWNGGWEQEDSDAPFYWSDEWRKLRDEVIERDGGKCTQCGNSPERLVVHHMLPLSEGGNRMDKKNLMTVCQSCHNYIHQKAYQ